jgi:UDP-N-acetylmuramoyl-L-alanyl-D-glutamate--2,6-diaminopimelate ligase
LAIEGRERTFRLAGRFNAYNLAAAYGTGRALGYAPAAVLDALAAAPPVPGRFEQLTFENGPTIVVDYAHTPDALEAILRAVRDTAPADATLWCVFGCGGDRDASKRPTMGGIAEEGADRVIVTSDNPRTEDPEAIMADIRSGFRRPDEAQWIVDREAAIEAAAEGADPGDVVLIAGKGHETDQTIGTEKRPFDDRKMARKYFS